MCFFFLVVPEPVAFYPLNAHYETTEKENRQPKGYQWGFTVTNGPYNEPGGAYLFYGYRFIHFPNIVGLDTCFSITLMCWVQRGDQDGPLFRFEWSTGVEMRIVDGKFYNQIKRRNFQRLTNISTAEVLPIGTWVHVAASYDHNTGNNSLYINGHFSVSQNIGKGYEIATTEYAFMGYDFKGKIAEMKIYDVALNEIQIQTSIRQGSCTFLEIVVSSPFPMTPLFNETPIRLDNLAIGSRHPFQDPIL